MTDNQPTPADQAHSLADDLKLAEAATPGPWLHWHNLWGDWSVGVPTDRWGDDSVAKAFWTQTIAALHAYRGQEAAAADAAFIAAARDGWPAAIRRAMAAEAEVQRLRAALDYAAPP